MSENVTTSNGWNEWSRHVLAELKRLNACIISTDTKFDTKFAHLEEIIEEYKKAVTDNKTDLAVLRVKAGLWGALAGSIPVVIVVLVLIFTGKLSF